MPHQASAAVSIGLIRMGREKRTQLSLNRLCH
jgi:hypothetical protein